MTLSPASIHDRLTVVWDANSIRDTAAKVLDRTQAEPHTQIVATAVALVLLCEQTGTNVRHLLETVERNLNDVDSPFSSTLRGIREYARHEILRRN